MLFVSDGPVELRTLARTLGVTLTVLGGAIEELRVRLDGRGLLLQTGPDGAQLITAALAAPYIEALLGIEQQRKLSNAALETLAIIAYRQPVTRATIESIRGVSSDGAMQTLRARGLIEDAGRSQAPGRPTLFATTQRFLEHFGLRSAQDLPDLGEVALPLPDTSIPMPGLDAAAPPSEAAVESEVAANLAALSAAALGLTLEGAPALLGPGPVTYALAAPASAVEAEPDESSAVALPSD
ncbi:MAG: SMC-Scp complex subunit ScpB [Dehalococcoidia bacterium]|nr:SMC-Scp complex subunit ScpB [Dehalococcoidia bacterium]